MKISIRLHTKMSLVTLNRSIQNKGNSDQAVQDALIDPLKCSRSNNEQSHEKINNAVSDQV